MKTFLIHSFTDEYTTIYHKVKEKSLSVHKVSNQKLGSVSRFNKD